MVVQDKGLVEVLVVFVLEPDYLLPQELRIQSLLEVVVLVHLLAQQQQERKAGDQLFQLSHLLAVVAVVLEAHLRQVVVMAVQAGAAQEMKR